MSTSSASSVRGALAFYAQPGKDAKSPTVLTLSAVAPVTFRTGRGGRIVFVRVPCRAARCCTGPRRICPNGRRRKETVLVRSSRCVSTALVDLAAFRIASRAR
ncbi:hypothetical protein HPB52_017806 [Rhipicephalus sanguineus]|uniref:Uncharacterized protein n=1 Tax=Rhipicephalus sanguineus TaxID=34632 RepID=A0A9D4Q8N4_RHISA|nr:hypothetical protein HPB52_017806 [Rhipicephalus sanguineus]